MPISPDAALFLGAHCTGAFQAELTALFWALCWCLQLPDHVHLEIVSDCTSAIGIATGTQGGTCEDPLVSKCRSAMHLLQALRTPHEITVRHTRSHVGDPGNEVADALAKRACHRGGAIDAAVLPDIARAAASPSFAWRLLPHLSSLPQLNVPLSLGLLMALLPRHLQVKLRPLSVPVC